MAASRKRNQIQQKVKALLQLADVIEAPIPIEKIARLCGAQLRYVPFEGELSGMLFQVEEQIIIGINALHSKTRQRFTIAHELGHLQLHSDAPLHVDRNFRVHLRDERSSQAIDQSEIEANAFAAELLMPADMIKRDLNGQEVVDYEDDELIRGLAENYRVSLQAMIFRLTNLGYIDRLTEASNEQAR